MAFCGAPWHGAKALIVLCSGYMVTGIIDINSFAWGILVQHSSEPSNLNELYVTPPYAKIKSSLSELQRIYSSAKYRTDTHHKVNQQRMHLYIYVMKGLNKKRDNKD